MSVTAHPTCVECGTPAPEAESLYVLIGEHGWRMLQLETPLVGPRDRTAIEWRCPACWLRYKEAASSAPPSSKEILAGAIVEDAKTEGPPKKPE